MNPTESNKPLYGALIALWAHFFWSLLPSWKLGGYYDYGYLVPVLALAFAWRRAGLVACGPAWNPGRALDLLMLAGAAAGLVMIALLRVVETGDNGWRIPLVLHGMIVTVVTHLALARGMGWKSSAYFVPVTIFAWSAVPYLSQIEQALVRHLTGWVIGITREVFLMGGAPVERMGERLTLGGQVVDVTEGCSGIRSIQSLVMAALFFGELLWLRLGGRLVLLGVAGLGALVFNTARAWYLAKVQFAQGLEAAERVHDLAGHLAFAGAALTMFLCALWLSPRGGRRRKVVRRSTTAAGGALNPSQSE